jgi:DNA repair exonuclease SbcCD ATPase subunit
MNAGTGFTDLRMHRQIAESDDGFWPSFTDIMTVIVMIFLLAMVILLMRNMELVEQLRATMLSEMAAEEKTDHLNVRVAALQQQLRQQQSELSRMESLSEQQEAAIASQQHQIDRLNRAQAGLLQENQKSAEQIDQQNQALAAADEAHKALQAAHERLRVEQQARLAEAQTLQAEKDHARQTLHELDAHLADLSAELALLKQSLQNRNAALDAEQRLRNDLQQRYGEVSQAFSALQDDYAKTLSLQQQLDEEQQANTRLTEENRQLRVEAKTREQILAQAMAQLEQANLSLDTLEQDYGALQLQYNELVKPARTAKGRYVVEVRVSKDGDELTLLYREAKTDAFQRIDRAVLESQLEQLKRRHKEGLYVRVIIPDDSGLSYKEAWNFTREMHARYDYYYVEGE